MKNKFVKAISKLGAVVLGCMLFASFSPSLDGRAIVVDEGVFPQGLFAKTVGYLPGDIISVANITGNATVDILVIGALDPSEGVAIMLSPEAASAVGIDKNANNIVKITKRSGQDERVYGTAIIAKSEPEINSGIPSQTESSENVLKDEIQNQEFDEEATDFEAEQQNIEDATDETDLESQEDDFEEEDFEEDDDYVDVDYDKMRQEIQNMLSELEEEQSENEEATPEDTETLGFEDIYDAEDTSSQDESEDDFSELVPEDELDGEPVENEFDEEAYVDDMSPIEYLPVEKTEDNVNETPYVEDGDFPEYTEEDEDFDPDEVLEDELIDDEDYDEYESIILVPTDSNPPEQEDVLEQDEVLEDSYIEKDEVEEVESVESIERISETEKIVEKTTENKTEETSQTISEKTVQTTVEQTKKEYTYKNHMVSTLSDLKNESYYIQIAALGNEDNIQEIIDKYEKNYPITVVPMKNGTTYQVLVGPLSLDEYAVVLTRFKSYGFKDAFLRKIK